MILGALTPKVVQTRPLLVRHVVTDTMPPLEVQLLAAPAAWALSSTPRLLFSAICVRLVPLLTQMVRRRACCVSKAGSALQMAQTPPMRVLNAHSAHLVLLLGLRFALDVDWGALET